MTYEINETHDQNLKSWIESANALDTDFPIQNLPFCTFLTQPFENAVENMIDKINRFAGEEGDELLKKLGLSESDIEMGDPSFEKFTAAMVEEIGAADAFAGRFGVAIGDKIFDLEGSLKDGLFANDSIHLSMFHYLPNKNSMENKLGLRQVIFSQREAQRDLRQKLIEIFREDADEETKQTFSKYLYSISDVSFVLPNRIGDYTDFYCSIYHATNVGKLFRPDNPLMPNYKWIPIGYHGRASSHCRFRRRCRSPERSESFKRRRAAGLYSVKGLDYEMEVGFFVGKGNELGRND